MGGKDLDIHSLEAWLGENFGENSTGKLEICLGTHGACEKSLDGTMAS